jgi:hypothetical protein
MKGTAHFWYSQHRKPALITSAVAATDCSVTHYSMYYHPEQGFTIQKGITHRFCMFFSWHCFVSVTILSVPSCQCLMLAYHILTHHQLSCQQCTGRGSGGTRSLTKKGNKFWYGNRNRAFETATVTCAGTGGFCAWIPHFSYRYQLWPTVQK